MPKEYRTIQEVAGPLMLVRGVEDVAFDELGEIELADGETEDAVFWRSTEAMHWCSCLRVPRVSTFLTAKYVFWDEAWSLVYPEICWDVSLTDWADRSMMAGDPAG